MAEDQYDQEEDFSYERDIAPMNRRFFEEVSASGLPAATQLSLVNERLARTDAQFARQTEILKVEAQRQAALLDRDRSLIELENSRRKTQQQLVQMQQLEPFQKMLTGITLGARPEEREPMLRQFGIANAGLIAGSETAKVAYDNALAAAEDKNAITVGQMIEKGVGLGTLKKLADADGMDFNQLKTDTKLSPAGAAFLLEETTKSKEQLDVEQRRREKEEEDQKQRISFLMKGIDDVKLKQDKLTGTVLDQFEDPTNEPILTTVVSTFGSPEQQSLYAKGTPTQKLNIVKQVRTQWAVGGLKPVTPKPTATSLFE